MKYFVIIQFLALVCFGQQGQGPKIPLNPFSTTLLQATNAAAARTVLGVSGGGGAIAGTVTATTPLTSLKVPMSDSTGTNLVDSTLSFTASTNAFLTGPLQGYNLHITSGTAALTANDPFSIIQTWNNAGVTFGGVSIVITNTASGGSSAPFSVTGGATAGVNLLSLDKNGNLSIAANFTAGISSSISVNGILNWTSRSRASSPADGNILLQNTAATSFGLLQFGLTTSAAPALKRNGAGLDVRLADDSNYAVIVSAGITNAGNATAGTPGEVVTSSIAPGASVALVTATGTNVTSISLTAGDWSVEGNINFSATTATVTGTSGGITTTTLTVPNDGTEVYSGVQVTLLSENDSVTIPRKRINVSGTTTVYLVGKCTFSAGSVSAFGAITATRIR